MPASFETHATASHRYYMRKTKAEIVRRIRDMLDMVPKQSRPQYEVKYGNGFSQRIIRYMLNGKYFSDSMVARMSRKDELASAAMLAHDLIGKVQAMPELDSCAADDDDMCIHPKCPQNRDGEPTKTGRHCPLHDPTWRDGDEG